MQNFCVEKCPGRFEPRLLDSRPRVPNITKRGLSASFRNRAYPVPCQLWPTMLSVGSLGCLLFGWCWRQLPVDRVLSCPEAVAQATLQYVADGQMNVHTRSRTWVVAATARRPNFGTMWTAMEPHVNVLYSNCLLSQPGWLAKTQRAEADTKS
jgi:hypothetical protein